MRIICLRALALLVGPVIFVSLLGCHSNPKPTSNSEKLPPSMQWYVHCDTCSWCKGPYKKTQEAEKLSREHNIKTHNYFRVAYYDTVKCSR